MISLFEIGRFNLNGELLNHHNKPVEEKRDFNPCVLQRVYESAYFDVERVGDILAIKFINGATVPFKLVDIGWGVVSLRVRERTVIRLAENDVIVLSSRWGVSDTAVDFVFETVKSKFSINMFCSVDGEFRIAGCEKQLFSASEMQCWRSECGVEKIYGVSILGRNSFWSAGFSYKRTGNYMIFKFPNGLTFFLKNCDGMGTSLVKSMLGIEMKKCRGTRLRIKSFKDDVYTFTFTFDTFDGLYKTQDIRYGFDYAEYAGLRRDTTFYTKQLLALG